MPNESLLEKQQAAYVAAMFMDNGSSPRGASKVADYSRRETLDLAKRRENNNLIRHTQQVILEYLRATLEQGMGPEERTPEAVAAAFPAADPDRVATDLRLLAADGWRESNGYANAGKKNSNSTKLPWMPPGNFQGLQYEEPDLPSMAPIGALTVGSDYLKKAASYHWRVRKPRANPDNYVGLNEWPGRRPRISTIISEALNEMDDLQEMGDYIDALSSISEAADLLIPFVAEPTTTRILCRLDNWPDQSPLTEGHKPWPSDGTLYVELEPPVTLESEVILHGVAAAPEPTSGTPETWLVALVLEEEEEIYLAVASIRPDNGETRCPVEGEHDCGMDLDLHLRVAAATAQAVSGPLEPEPMNRQQRRLLKRKGWPTLWLFAENATGGL